MPKLGAQARGEGSRDGPKVSGSGSVEPIACLVRRRPRRIRSASRGRARARAREAVRRPTSPPWRMSKRGLSSKRTVLRSGSRRPVTSQRGSSASARRFRCRSRCMQERERTRPVCEPALTVSPLIATFHARRHASRCRRERRRGDLSAPSETPALVAATRTRTRASVHPGPALPPPSRTRALPRCARTVLSNRFTIRVINSIRTNTRFVYISANGTETHRLCTPLPSPVPGPPSPSPRILSFAREQHKFPRQQLLKLISR